MDTREILYLGQGQDEYTKAYYRRFEEAISTYELAKCTATTQMELNKTYTRGNNYNVTKRFQDMCLLMSDNYEQYWGIWGDLKNATLMGREKYSNTPTTAYNMLFHYKHPTPQHQSHTTLGAVTFVHSDNENNRKKVPGNYRMLFADIMCYRYQEMVHYRGKSLSPTDNTCSGSQLLQVGLTTTKNKHHTGKWHHQY